ncbi:TetR/AcrR family transcriptional regulator [Bordetella genomosp. 12]|uniref:TetR family transcriptional regulator n=1 Tax=Bordetella genomosp. 12 TaxID=463035 RepID=A0A261VU78_9BORD|nr:TetR/AcrR family transcriptional regulator [Bordetella genomosp. 12]OZI77042.1 TetR family transcriptional regulator [Bordetella genomosp. 12]
MNTPTPTATRDDGMGNIALLSAAAECFMEQGFYATSIDDVAQRLGATKGRVYHYYRSKTDLFFDVHREGMRRNFEAVRPAMQDGANGAERLAAMFHRHALTMMENLAFETVVVHGVHMHRQAAITPAQRRTLDELMVIRDDFEALFKTVASEGAADGSLRTDDASVAVKAALGAINWMAIWYRPRQGETEQDRDALARKIVSGLMSGLAARQP